MRNIQFEQIIFIQSHRNCGIYRFTGGGDRYLFVGHYRDVMDLICVSAVGFAKPGDHRRKIVFRTAFETNAP